MVSCRVTFDFYKKNPNGLFAHKEWSETVEIFGCHKSDIMTEDGKNVQERWKLLLLVEMGLSPADIDRYEYDYHTVECTEHDIPDDEDEEPEQYANGEMIIEIDRETGKFEIISDGGKNGKR